jgi:hypothetical protein
MSDYSLKINEKIEEILVFVNKLPMTKKQRIETAKSLIKDQFTINFDEAYIDSDEEGDVEALIDEIDEHKINSYSGSETEGLDIETDEETDEETDVDSE